MQIRLLSRGSRTWPSPYRPAWSSQPEIRRKRTNHKVSNPIVMFVLDVGIPPPGSLRRHCGQMPCQTRDRTSGPSHDSTSSQSAGELDPAKGPKDERQPQRRIAWLSFISSSTTLPSTRRKLTLNLVNGPKASLNSRRLLKGFHHHSPS